MNVGDYSQFKTTISCVFEFLIFLGINNVVGIYSTISIYLGTRCDDIELGWSCKQKHKQHRASIICPYKYTHTLKIGTQEKNDLLEFEYIINSNEVCGYVCDIGDNGRKQLGTRHVLVIAVESERVYTVCGAWLDREP